jgi:N-acetylglucosamine transport system permease protein
MSFFLRKREKGGAGMKHRKGRNGFIAVCVLPAIILFIIFMIVPTINVFKMSLYKWGGFSNNKTFVGLNNFKILFEDPKFYRSFQNSVLLIVMVTIITMVFSLIFAAILSREKIKGQNFFRIIFYIPNILSVVVISAIFSAIYDPSQGLLNSILSIFRGAKADPILWLGNQKLVVYSLVIAMVWQAIGYYMVMYMASMSSVPESLYESANLEGAGRVHQFFNITLPLIWTNIRTTLTFFIISTINLSFLFVKAMTGGKPDGASEVFLSYMYGQAYTNSSYGYGMAIGVIVFLFSFGLAGLVNLATKREPLEF